MSGHGGTEAGFQRLRTGTGIFKNILRERGILDRIPSREVLDVIDSLSDEDAELLLDRGTFSALSGLLEGIDGL